MKTLLDIAQKYHAGRHAVRETQGKNRSPWIDEANRLVGNRPGDPYCVAGILKCQSELIADDAEMMELIQQRKMLPLTGSSQFLRRWADRNHRLTFDPQDLLHMRGALGGWTNADGQHGHLFVIEQRLTRPGKIITAIRTIEFNTSAKTGERDGEGCFALKRSVPQDRGHQLWFVDMTGLHGGNWWT